MHTQPDAVDFHRIDNVGRFGAGHQNRQGLLRFQPLDSVHACRGLAQDQGLRSWKRVRLA
jgi:hypothetical protein